MVSDYYEALMILAAGIVIAGFTFLWFLRLSPARRRRRRRRGRRDGSLRVDLFQPPDAGKDRAGTEADPHPSGSLLADGDRVTAPQNASSV